MITPWMSINEQVTAFKELLRDYHVKADKGFEDSVILLIQNTNYFSDKPKIKEKE